MSFRTKVFLSALAAAVLGLAVAGVLFAESMRARTNERIARTLVASARLTAELLGRLSPPQGEPIQEEAVRIGAIIGARVTLIAPDGRVVGDSSESAAGLRAMENHAGRPEVVAARASGLGESRRHSHTLGIDMLYVAVPVPRADIGVVRVALPLTDLREQLASIVRATVVALVAALAGAALIAWVVSGRLGARVRRIARIARRYRAGDLDAGGIDYGTDELGVVANALDESVHELGRRLGELARDRARMEAILGSMAEGVIVVDAAGVVQMANGAARRMLGLDALAIGRHYVEVSRHPAIDELFTAALGGQVPEPLELSPGRDPSRVLVAYAAPAAGEDRTFGAALVLHDVTEERRVDRVRRDFVANVSHELRTPLTAIRGYVEAVADDRSLSDEGRRFIAIVQHHTVRMERLVADLLRLARLEAGQDTARIETVDTRRVLDAVAAGVMPLARARDQQLRIDVAADAETMKADESKLRDALQNLVANAIAYAPEHTTIDLDAARHDGRVVLAVSDHGPGIPEPELSRIFERFYRVDKSRARDAGGTGLGLAITKHLIELQGGEVKAENRRGGGARFTISVPG